MVKPFRLAYIITGVILLVVFSTAVLYKLQPALYSLNPVHSYLAFRVYNKWSSFIYDIPEEKRSIVNYDELMNSLNFAEREFAERIFSIDPKTLGFKGPFFGRDKADNLVMIPSRFVGEGKGKTETGIQYCPKHSYRDYERMMNAMHAAIGKRLYIDSGYRSPGRQAYLFFYYLVHSNDYNLTENAKWIAMPGYSEHGSPKNNAIDFVSGGGINGFSDGQTAEDFEELEEFAWLMKNAKSFNFYLTYPPDNPYGVAYEPWHWHWEGDVLESLKGETTIH
ncbi:MAG: D-alanyl-D-alanine carboxypeptidase family protein [Ignavibacteriaceae bacterium]|nr:D-alanyl-D-alanine carboxypeptidase family protein [Ignavibacteriaceae bacterium]